MPKPADFPHFVADCCQRSYHGFLGAQAQNKIGGCGALSEHSLATATGFNDVLARTQFSGSQF
jgi:hypothetical protein